MENPNRTAANSLHPMNTNSCGTEERPCSQQRPRKGKRVGPKRPFMSGHVWETREYLKLKGRTRDLALFDLRIDSKLRACDLLDIQVSDVSSGSTIFQPATIVQKKTEMPVHSKYPTQLGHLFRRGLKTQSCHRMIFLAKPEREIEASVDEPIPENRQAFR